MLGALSRMHKGISDSESLGVKYGRKIRSPRGSSSSEMPTVLLMIIIIIIIIWWYPGFGQGK